MRTLPAVNGSISIVDDVKQFNKSVNEGRDAYYAIPDDLFGQFDPTDRVRLGIEIGF